MRPSAAATALSPSPIPIGATRCATPSSKARSRLGIPRNPDYNGKIQEGVAYAQRTIQNGRRMSAARAFLHPAMKRSNLRVITHAHTTNLVLEGKRAVGVRYLKGGRGGTPHEVRARREVILAAGSYNSPQLLQLSGIGPAALLKSLGINVQHALAGVGENLRDHYAPRFVARVKNIDTINERVRGLRLVGEIAKYLFTRKGVLSLSPTHVYCFWRSDPQVANSDLQLTFTPASYREGVQGELEREPGMTVASWQQRPESRGYVRLRSADPFEAPIIQPNYLALESDRRVLLAGMRLARRLLKSKPLEPYYDHEDFPGPGVQTDDELLGAAKQRGTTTFHPSGTCRMGPASDSNGRGRRSAARARPRWAQGDRRLRDADHALRQPQRRHADDRREGLRHAARPRGPGAGRDCGGVSLATRRRKYVRLA